MKRPRPGFTIRRMIAATAAVVALALVALGIQRLSLAVASYRQRAALRAEEAAREQAARDRAITIAAREYERMHGNPPPSAATVAPDQVSHVIARREADGKDYLVRFGYQYVVNDQRDSSGRPIPFQSGLTVLETFRVKPDETCAYEGLVESGQYLSFYDWTLRRGSRCWNTSPKRERVDPAAIHSLALRARKRAVRNPIVKRPSIRSTSD